MSGSLVQPPLTKSLAARSFSALLWSYAGALSKVLAQLVIQVALARMLGPLAFGQAAMVLVVLGFGWLLADGGFGSALIQKAELNDDDVAYALGWVSALSLFIGAIIFASAPLLAVQLNDAAYVDLMRACGVLVPLQALSNIPMSLLRRNLDMKRQQLLNVGGYLAGVGVVGMALALAGYGAWALVVGFAAQTVINLVVGYLAVRFPLRIKFRGDSVLRNFGFSVMATNMANWAIDSLDRIVIGRLWGSTSLGEYSAAGNLSRAPAAMLVGAAQSVVFASASRVQDDHARVRRGFIAAASLVLLITAPVFCFLSLHAPLVMHLLYGERWSSAAPLFAALCLAIPSYALLSIVGPTLWGVGAARSEFKVQILVVGLLMGGLFLLSGYPLTIVVWLVPALYALRSVLVLMALARRIDLSVGPVLKAVLAAAVLSGFVLLSSLLIRALQFGLIAEGLLSAISGLVLCLLTLQLGSRWLLVSDLRLMLLGRAKESALARRLCLLLGLKAESQ
jgi:O-antigen/teichoic acid export membrane protein